MSAPAGRRRRPVLGLALGGGGARCLAQLGVLEVLEEAGLRPDLIAGVSFGAMIGAVYAHDPRAAAAMEKIAAFLESDAFLSSRLRLMGEKGTGRGGALSDTLRALFLDPEVKGGGSGSGILAPEEFTMLVDGIVPDVDLESLRIPFAAVASDLLSGEEVVLEKGPARFAVAASSAVPGVVPPFAWDGRLLVDGGFVNRSPSRVLRERGAGFVLGVDVSVRSEMEAGESLSAAEVVLRASDLMSRHLTRMQAGECDALIRVAMEGVHWADFDQMELCVQAGRREARGLIARLLPGAPDSS